MIRMLAAAALTIAATIGAFAVAGRASAATPTPTPTARPTPEATDLGLTLSTDPLALSWTATANATSYHLTASILVVEANASDPFCTPPFVAQSKQIDVDVDLAAGTTSYAITTPPAAAGDKWFAATVQATLVGKAEDGATVGVGQTAFVSETQCARPQSPPPPTVLTEDTMVNGCLIPAGFIEVTTEASLNHGQRVFADDANRANRIYVLLLGDEGCVHLLASADMPFPEFVPQDLPLSPPGSAPYIPNRGAGGLHPPDTGSGPAGHGDGANATPLLVITTFAIVMAGAGLVLRRTKRG